MRNDTEIPYIIHFLSNIITNAFFRTRNDYSNSRIGLESPIERLTHNFGRICKSAGLKIRFHDLRHSCASLMLMAGVHPKIVSEMLGHSTVAITLDIYSHVTPGLQEAAAKRLDSLLPPGIAPAAKSDNPWRFSTGLHMHAPIAQRTRASVFGTGGRGFESL